MFANARADQAQGRQSDRCGHAAHLAVAAFRNTQLQPGGWNALAEPYRRVTWPQPIGCRFEGAHLGRPRGSILELYAPAQGGECIITRHAFDFGEIGLDLVMARIGDAMGECTIVGQQQQAFGIHVQASGRIDVFFPDVVGQGRTPLGVGELAQHAVGLVEQDQHRKGAAGGLRHRLRSNITAAPALPAWHRCPARRWRRLSAS